MARVGAARVRFRSPRAIEIRPRVALRALLLLRVLALLPRDRLALRLELLHVHREVRRGEVLLPPRARLRGSLGRESAQKLTRPHLSVLPSVRARDDRADDLRALGEVVAQKLRGDGGELQALGPLASSHVVALAPSSDVAHPASRDALDDRAAAEDALGVGLGRGEPRLDLLRGLPRFRLLRGRHPVASLARRGARLGAGRVDPKICLTHDDDAMPRRI
eukprot:1325-Pelagococcus_subviridis.AAC.1